MVPWEPCVEPAISTSSLHTCHSTHMPFDYPLWACLHGRIWVYAERIYQLKRTGKVFCLLGHWVNCVVCTCIFDCEWLYEVRCGIFICGVTSTLKVLDVGAFWTSNFWIRNNQLVYNIWPTLTNIYVLACLF